MNLTRLARGIVRAAVRAALPIAVCAACTERQGSPAGGAPTLRSAILELQLEPPQPEDPPRGVELPFPASGEAWAGGLTPISGGARLDGARGSVRFPGRIALRDARVIAFRVSAAAAGSARLALVASGAELAAGELEWSSAGARTLRLELGVDLLDDLEVRLEARVAGAVELAAPRLEFPLGAPWEGELAGDPTRVVSVPLGLESRAARILRPGWRLVGRGRAPSAAAKLALDFGALDRRGAGSELALEASIERANGTRVEQRFELDWRNRWAHQVVALECDEGEALELTLELVGDAAAHALVAVPSLALYTPEPAPRTVLLVTSDTHRGDHVEGARGAPLLETPALRELAARGVSYDDCWSTINITVPSHVAMLSGLHPRDSGITDNQTTFSDAPTTLPEVFRGAGWHTFAVTSINLLTPTHSGLGQGFERMVAPLAARTSDKTVDAALRMLDEASDRSVFFWVHVFDAHGPYEPPVPFDRKFYAAQRDPKDPSIEPEPGMRVPSYLPGVRDAEYIRALYRGEIASVDRELARLFAHPRVRAGVVAFTGDHGEVLGRHGIWWAHKDIYPDTLHVPLILAWPAAPGGTRVSAPVQNSDVGRTLLDLAGYSGMAFPGRDLARIEALESASPRFALSGARTSASITRDGWHLIMQLAVLDEPEQRTHRVLHEVELFRLSDDPDCAHNLVQGERQRAQALRAELLSWLAQWKGERFAASKRTDAATAANLAQLGYASNSATGDARAPLYDDACACAWCQRWR